jgi:hypothetical protein
MDAPIPPNKDISLDFVIVPRRVKLPASRCGPSLVASGREGFDWGRHSR